MRTILSKKAPKPVGPYSQAVSTNGFVFLSGQIGINPKSGTIESDTIEGQTEQIIKNIEEVLKASKLGLENIVNTTCYLKNINDFKAFNEVYGKHFDKVKPARTTVEVSNLPLGALVEVSVIAVE